MKKFFNVIDTGFRRVVDVFVGLSMFLLMVIVFIQVVARYFLHASIGGIEEMPVYLMVASVWFASSAACATNSHISLDILPLLVKSARIRAGITVFTDLVASAALVYFFVIMQQYMVRQIGEGTISAGLRFPVWIMTLIMVFNIALMCIYTLKNAYDELEVAKHGNTD